MRTGHVHGRFQPFHNEHAAYVKWAQDHCDQLIIGITNADHLHTTEEDTDPDRHRSENNPYSYFERLSFIDAFITANEWQETLIAPFPINKPNLWPEYAPQSVTHYVNIVEDWDQKKAERLRDYDRTVVTKQETRTTSGTSVRKKMRGGENWESHVPKSVVDEIKSRDLVLPK